ncbi:MAG TPA: hypothetical protein VH496_20445 [Mycobacterium sp.]|jgi:hypothetical protein
MLVAAVLCLCAAGICAVMGCRGLARPAAAGDTRQVLRAVAPTQLAAAVMLAAGGVVALSDRPSVPLLALCVTGAVSTVAVGVWQAARYADAMLARSSTCSRSGDQPCATCTLSCR